MPTKPRRTTSARPPKGDKLDYLILQNDLILEKQNSLNLTVQLMEKKLMATVEQVIAKIEEQTTVVGSLETLMDELVVLVRAGRTDPAKLDQALSLLESNRARISDAVKKGTDAENEPPPA
jgi:hypothetical protein